MVGLFLIVFLVVGLAAGAFWLARFLRRELSALRSESGSQLAERNLEVDRRLQGVIETMDRRLSALDTKVDRRLETASQTTTQIHERLGKVDEATAQMLERAKDLARLEQALRPPKARGGFGELLLANLLRDRLPPDAYALQHTFKSGERVDAVIRVDRLVPVDAKFPLDNFQRLIEAQDDGERVLGEKAFARDVKTHIDAIAAKYIRPDEGTYDFAFMYVPAEAVYYELVCGKTGALLQYAGDKCVFPVSPTTFSAYLQVIAIGLKGLQIEQHAHEVMAYCGQLARDFDRFRADFDVVGKHITNAQAKYGEADRKLERLEARVEQAAEWEETLEPAEALELPRAAAVDAA
jgi:DNA recombination protein RmuC